MALEHRGRKEVTSSRPGAARAIGPGDRQALPSVLGTDEIPGPLLRRVGIDVQRMAGNRAVQALVLRARAPSPASTAPVVQRDITATLRGPEGSFQFNFHRTRNAELPPEPQFEYEAGELLFHPNPGPPDREIRFVQIVRTTDTAGKTTQRGADVDWRRVDTGQEAPRNRMRTARNRRRGVRGGFYVDQQAAVLGRQHEVSPYYHESGPRTTANIAGSRAPGYSADAILYDSPGGPLPMRYAFETSVRSPDTGHWYGTVYWGFRAAPDGGGIVRIVSEDRPHLRAGHSATMDDALARFEAYWTSQGKTVTPLDRHPARPGVPAQRQVGPTPTVSPEAAIRAIQRRFSDPYSIHTIRTVLGLAATGAVDADLVSAVAARQASAGRSPTGRIGHAETRDIFVELVHAHRFRDAISLVHDSYDLPSSSHLDAVEVGLGQICCGTTDRPRDAVTRGGPHCEGGPIRICFCRTRIPTTAAGFDRFVRVVGHEFVHPEQCAAGTGDVHVDEFEASFNEVCGFSGAPRQPSHERLLRAFAAAGHFDQIPPALRTPERSAMRGRLNPVIRTRGVASCSAGP